MKNKLSILLVGGYGVVGTQVAELLQKYDKDIAIIIAGRNVDKATKFVNSLFNATALFFDIMAPKLPDDIQPNLIVTLANDPNNRTLKFAIEHHIAYLDITRWTDRLKTAVTYTHSFEQLQSPVVFSSSWMASLPANLIINALKSFNQIDNISINILYSLYDKAGINSVEYMDRMLMPFEVMENGQVVNYKPFTDKKLVHFSNNKKFNVYRFDMPDQLLLPMLTGAKSVSTRIGFDSNITNKLFYFLIHSGFWQLISGRSFKQFRQKLLYNPGKGAEHNIQIILEGENSSHKKITAYLSIAAPKGQTHLTAVGTFLQIITVLYGNLSNKVYFGDSLLNTEQLKQRLIEEGIEITYHEK